MKIKYLMAGVLMGSVVFGAAACEREAMDPQEGRAPTADERPTATVQGRLESELGPVSGAAVVVQRVADNGTLENIAIGEARTDEQGAYEVTIDMTGGPFYELVVEARPGAAPVPAEQQAAGEEGAGEEAANGEVASEDEAAAEPAGTPPSDEQVGRALVVTEINEGDSVVAPPIGYTTTLEADVFVQARTAGEWDERCDAALLRLMISPELAATARTGGAYKEDVEVLARSTTAGMKAGIEALRRDRGFEDEEGTERAEEQPAEEQVAEQQAAGEQRAEGQLEAEGQLAQAFTEEDLQAVRTEIRNAARSYDQRLHEGVDAEGLVDARRNFQTAVLDAYTNNNITVHQQARAAHAAAEAELVFFDELSDAAQARAIADAEGWRALTVTRSIERSADTIGLVGENFDEVRRSGVTLRDTIDNLGAGTGDITEDVHTAWDQYRQSVDEGLQAGFDATQRRAFNAVRSDFIRPRAEVLAPVEGLDARTSSTAVADATAEAVPEFFARIVNPPNVERLTQADVTEENARAMLNVMFHFSLVDGQPEAPAP